MSGAVQLPRRRREGLDPLPFANYLSALLASVAVALSVTAGAEPPWFTWPLIMWLALTIWNFHRCRSTIDCLDETEAA